MQSTMNTDAFAERGSCSCSCTRHASSISNDVWLQHRHLLLIVIVVNAADVVAAVVRTSVLNIVNALYNYLRESKS